MYKRTEKAKNTSPKINSQKALVQVLGLCVDRGREKVMEEGELGLSPFTLDILHLIFFQKNVFI